MFQQPILIWSRHCTHSKTFINLLKTNKNIFDSFVLLNIDVNPETKRRPDSFFQVQKALNYKITDVPTIIVNNGEYVLSGEEAFNWLEFVLSSSTGSAGNARDEAKGTRASDKSVHEVEVSGFNQNEMSSFSDSYAKVGSTELTDASEQTFSFIGKEYDRIETPEESSVLTSDEYSKKEFEREQFDVNVNRQVNYGAPNSKMLNDWKKNAVSHGESNSNKQKDFDTKYQQLLAQRESI